MLLDKCQIVYHHGNCLNTKKAFAHPCRLCIDNCPMNAISESNEIITNVCTECGLCTSVCPSEGFIDRRIPKLFNYLENTNNVQIKCPESDSTGYEIGCLGVLDSDAWKTLLIFAQDKNVRIFTGDCTKCLDRTACNHSISILKELLSTWRKSINFKIIVQPVSEDIDRDKNINNYRNSTEDNYSKNWRIRTIEKLEELVPSITADNIYPIPLKRQWLQKMLVKNPEQKIPFNVIKISKDCTSCEVCTAICPQGALTSVSTADKIRIIHEPLKCVGCTRCVQICQTKAISFNFLMIKNKHLSGKVLLYEGTPRYCSRCGKQIFDNHEPQVCTACRTSENQMFI